MCNNLRLLIHKKISQVIQNTKFSNPANISANLKLKLDKSTRKFLFILPLRSKNYNIIEKVPELLENESNDFLEHIEINKNNPKELIFHIRRDYYIKNLLHSLRKSIVPPNFICEKPENIIVEFSSPNIAKPFHVGHFRSTMIGNCIANISRFFENNVKRINYLGDWGTQFGFVELGISLRQISEETIKKDPINTLYDAYIYANKLAEEDPTIADQARQLFQKLESGDQKTLLKWKSFRKYTIEELTRTYNRIGVNFDEYHWESMYSTEKISNVISEMKSLNLLNTDKEGRKIIHLTDKKSIPVLKSDGSSLYIIRDIAAAIDRFEKYNFDTMYYVVDNAQTNYFLNLIGILKTMKIPWVDKLKHIRFGKIRGMSTRKGTVVFLHDILDEIQTVMKKKQIESPTTKINLDHDDSSTEILGLSAIIINDLKRSRIQDYDFDWDQALDAKGETGVKLQYTHCRLVNLEKNSGATIASECIPSLLIEPSAEDLIYVIGTFDEAVMKSYIEQEPCVLARYLFNLSHVVNKALKDLQIKGEPAEIANQRLMLMHLARKVFAQSMRLLGLTPLDKM